MFTLLQTQDFQNWLDGLRDLRAQIRIVARLRLAEAGNLGDWKSVGGNVSEMRVDIGSGVSIWGRLYFTRRGNVLIIMLAGSDKATQAKDIARAKQILKLLELE